MGSAAAAAARESNQVRGALGHVLDAQSKAATHAVAAVDDNTRTATRVRRSGSMASPIAATTTIQRRIFQDVTRTEIGPSGMKPPPASEKTQHVTTASTESA